MEWPRLNEFGECEEESTWEMQPGDAFHPILDHMLSMSNVEVWIHMNAIAHSSHTDN